MKIKNLRLHEAITLAGRTTTKTMSNIGVPNSEYAKWEIIDVPRRQGYYVYRHDLKVGMLLHYSNAHSSEFYESPTPEEMSAMEEPVVRAAAGSTVIKSQK